MKALRIFLLTFVVTFAGALTGCAALTAALPMIIPAISEAALILDQIQTFVGSYFKAHPDAVKETEVTDKLQRARATLVAAERATSGADHLNQKQWDSAIADFKAAYTDLLAAVSPLGVHQGGGLLTAPGPGLSVPEPTALTLKVPQ